MMAIHDEDKPKNAAAARGAGGPLESKVITFPDAGTDSAPQQTEDEQQPEASDQTTAES
jgi:hypothetical protein